MALNYENFHLVTSGDNCDDLASEYGTTREQIYLWNPAVGSNCQFLDLGDYVCVGTATCTTASVLDIPPQYVTTCGLPGFSNDGSDSLLIVSYTTGSPYVASISACGAQCLAISSCTNLYFIQDTYCNLHQGTSTFQESTAAGSYSWYEASCFSSARRVTKKL